MQTFLFPVACVIAINKDMNLNHLKIAKKIKIYR